MICALTKALILTDFVHMHIPKYQEKNDTLQELNKRMVRGAVVMVRLTDENLVVYKLTTLLPRFNVQ